MKVYFFLVALFIVCLTYNAKINKEVIEDFEMKTTNAFTIVMKGFPDLENLIDPNTNTPIKKLDVISKRRLVYSTIRLSSELAQFSIKKYLEENKLSFRSLWIGNSIYVDENHLNNLELIEKISKRSDVQEIISSRTRDLNFEKVGKKIKKY